MNQSLKNLFSFYTIYARFFPALISALPLLILWYFISPLNGLSGLGVYILGLKFACNLTLGGVILYFYSQIIRTIAKVLERKYFLEKRGFPTTYLMLYDDRSFSTSYKDAYRAKIKKVFKLDLPTDGDERENIAETIKRLNETTKQLILYVGNGRLVLEHNVWYGFF